VYFETPLDVSPVQLTNYSSRPITLVSVTPATLTRSLRVVGGFLGGRCLVGNTPEIVEFNSRVRTNVYLHTWKMRPILMLPSKKGYCCLHAQAHPRCGAISSPFFPVITLRAVRSGKITIRGFNVLYRSDGRIYREFISQHYTIESLGACRSGSCDPLSVK